MEGRVPVFFFGLPRSTPHHFRTVVLLFADYLRGRQLRILVIVVGGGSGEAASINFRLLA